jgi:probable H4MPT-linked C1 transfer pathway protein
MPSEYYGWDLGGAHVKVAQLNADGDIVRVHQRPCPLWKGVAELSGALLGLSGDIKTHGALHALTMTGELCDIFPNRQEGVRQILGCFQSIFDPGEIVVYGGYEGWLPVNRVLEHVQPVASANWLAVATFMAERTQNSIVLDIGSTTSDIILICDGEVRCEGRDDAMRLTNDELLYSGVVRTPVMAVCDRIPYAGQWQNIASEHFATMADVYRIMGWLHDDDDQMDTPDGQPKDLFNSARRLARMLGRDYDPRGLQAIKRVARFVSNCQLERLQRSVACVLSRIAEQDRVDTLVGAGAGAFVAERLALANGMDFLDFATVAQAPETMFREVRNCAPAVCLAKLAWITR